MNLNTLLAVLQLFPVCFGHLKYLVMMTPRSRCWSVVAITVDLKCYVFHACCCGKCCGHDWTFVSIEVRLPLACLCHFPLADMCLVVQFYQQYFWLCGRVWYLQQILKFFLQCWIYRSFICIWGIAEVPTHCLVKHQVRLVPKYSKFSWCKPAESRPPSVQAWVYYAVRLIN